jgi:hypothetical protein
MAPGGSVAPLPVQQNAARAYKEEPDERKGCVLDPDNPLIRFWECVVACAILVSCVLGIFMATLQSTAVSAWVAVYMVDVINVVDIIQRFFLTYKDKRGIPITDRKAILRNYMKTGFGLDLLSVLPLEGSLILLPHLSATNQLFSVFRLNRLVRFWRVLNLFGKFKKRNRSPKKGLIGSLDRSRQFLTLHERRHTVTQNAGINSSLFHKDGLGLLKPITSLIGLRKPIMK